MATTEIHVDAVKLTKLIASEIDSIRSMSRIGCVSGEIIIGNVRGMQITLVTNADEDEHEDVQPRFECVTVAKKANATKRRK